MESQAFADNGGVQTLTDYDVFGLQLVLYGNNRQRNLCSSRLILYVQSAFLFFHIYQTGSVLISNSHINTELTSDIVLHIKQHQKPSHHNTTCHLTRAKSCTASAIQAKLR